MGGARVRGVVDGDARARLGHALDGTVPHVGEEGVMAIVGPLGASTDGKPVEPIKPLGFLLESE